jgi:hypothetical protein
MARTAALFEIEIVLMPARHHRGMKMAVRRAILRRRRAE